MAEKPVELIDSDVHVYTRARDELLDYLEEPWRSRAAALPAGSGDGGRSGYLPFMHSKRLDSFGPDGSPAGSDPELVSRQLLAEMGVDYAVVQPTTGFYSANPEQARALCAASNRWLEATWLSKYNPESRYFGSIFVCFDDPAAAVCEIETWAGHPGFKQILVHHLSDRPLGHPQYEAIWAAAARHRLPVAMHFGSIAGHQSGATPVGILPHYVDYHALSTPLEYSAHLLSWICNGVFDRHPDLRVLFIEGGFLWHRPILARLARHWALTSSGLNARAKDPYQYVLEHVRFCSQPIEEAPNSRDVATLFELAGAERTLLFSSDYPHYDYDSPTRALPPQLSPALRRRILSENARELYGLPATRVIEAE